MSERRTHHAAGDEYTRYTQHPQRLTQPLTRNPAENRNRLCEDLVPGYQESRSKGDCHAEKRNDATAEFSDEEQLNLCQAEAVEKDSETWERFGTERCVKVGEERKEDAVSVSSDSQPEVSAHLIHPVELNSAAEGDPAHFRTTSSAVEENQPSPQLFSQTPHLFRNVSGVVEENWLSPQLFSQTPQSHDPAYSPKPLWRERKLRPLLTAPDEAAKSAGDSPAILDNNEEKKLAADDSDFTVDKKPSCKQAGCLDAENCTDMARGCVLTRETAFQQLACDDLHLPANGLKSVSGAVEPMDFSGFEDSFPESDVQDEQLLAAEKAAMSGSSMLGETSGITEAKCGLGIEWEDEGDGCTSPGGGKLVSMESGHGAQQCGPAEDSRSTSTLSSPGFVIADGALSYTQGEEDSDASKQTWRTVMPPSRQDGSWDTLPADTGKNCYAVPQKLKKAGRFAHQLQALHPHVNDRDKENYFRLNHTGRVSQAESFSAHNTTHRPALIQSLDGNFHNLSDSDHLLAPSAPTDSPPLDLSPPSSSAGHAAFSGRPCDDDSRGTLTQTASLALKRHSPHLPSSGCSELRTLATQGEMEPNGLPKSRFLDNCAQLQAPAHSLQTCLLDSGPASERSLPSEGGAKGPSNARGFTAARNVGLGKFRKPGMANVSGCLPHTQVILEKLNKLTF